MKNYVMMTNENLNAITKATTQINFTQHGNEYNKQYY